MRPTCYLCAIKHLSQAIVLINESKLGYPNHKWLAVGHMAEASDELLAKWPEMASEIRHWRKILMHQDDVFIPLMTLIGEIDGRESS